MTRSDETLRGMRLRVLRGELDRQFGGDPMLGGRLEPPAGGWLKAIRTGLGMTAQQLGRRVGSSQAWISQAERSEAHETIQLKTLRQLASALNCDLVYALVPRAALEVIVHNQANHAAQRMVTEVARGMDLEGQATDESARAAEVDALRERLIARGSSAIWE